MPHQHTLRGTSLNRCALTRSRGRPKGVTPSRCAGSCQLPSVATSSQEFTLSSSNLSTPPGAISCCLRPGRASFASKGREAPVRGCKIPTMDENVIRGTHADQSGWVTTRVAAQALRVDPRTIRKYIKQGKLESKVEGEGVEKAYLVSIDSVHAMRGRAPERTGPRAGRENSPRESAGSAVSEDLVALVRELTTEVSRHSAEAAELRTRLQLTERAESSQREALEQRLETEQLRREQAEQERDKLAAELEALREPREALETTSEEAPVTHAPPTPQDPVERPSWWRKFFGFE